MVHRFSAFDRSFRRFLAVASVLIVAAAVILPADKPTRNVAAIATPSCTFVLQAVGFPAIAHGNHVLLENLNVDVVAETSGLWVLMLCVAALAIAISWNRRPHWERAVIAVSSIPIALFTVFVRIIATCTALHWFGAKSSTVFFSGVMALTMLPIAMILLRLECAYLNHLLIEPDPTISPRLERTFPLVTCASNPRPA